MADSIGVKIGVEGEKAFKQALYDINQSFKVLGSEMKLVASEFDKNDASMEALTARNQVLNKEIDAQKEKIETLRAALDNASESFGENDRRTQNWQIQLNNAEAALNKMVREVEENDKAMDSLGDSSNEAGDAMSPGDVLTVNTGYSKKDAILKSGDVETNVLKFMDAGSTFIQLAEGDNLFRCEAGSGVDNMEIVVYHSGLYLGV